MPDSSFVRGGVGRAGPFPPPRLSRARWLASSSLAAWAIGSAPAALAQVCNHQITAGIVNTGVLTNVCVQNTSFTGTILSTGTISPNGVVLQNGTISGAISNFTIGGSVGGVIDGGIHIDSQSVISAPTASGIRVALTTSFTGGITNAGTISAAIGIEFDHAKTVTGPFINHGTIATVLTGIFVGSASTFTGGITNTGLISSSAELVGIHAQDVNQFFGGISNSGTISAGFGIGLNGFTAASTFAGGITNSGTIVAGEGISLDLVDKFGSAGDAIYNIGTISISPTAFAGILIDEISTFAADIVNAGGGLISAKTGIEFGDLDATFSGRIVNSGTIAAGQYGIRFFTNAVTSFLGGITNAGVISAGGTAIVIGSAVSFAGGITNSGTLSGGALGIYLKSVSTFAGGVSNGGTITAPIGIVVDSGVTFAPGSHIVNTGLISGSTAAIDLTNATSPVIIDQIGGTIAGDVKLSANADVLNVDGGAIAGNIVGLGSSNAITFAPGVGNAFTYAGGFAFTGIDQVNVASGTAVLDGPGNSATHVTVASGATLQIGDASNPGARLASANPIDVAGTLAVFGTVGGATIEAGGTVVLDGGIVNGNLVGNGTGHHVTIVAGTLNGSIIGVGTSDTFAVAGGTISGNILGSGVGAALDFVTPAGHTFVYAAPYGFSFINQVNVSSGTVILDGVNSATAISVAGGTLEVGDAANTHATLTGGVNVGSGGVLAGHGTIVGAVTIGSGGTLMPGGSAGTLTVNGALTFNPGALYAVQLGGGGNSNTVVTGTATLNGAAVAINASGPLAPLTPYTILQAGQVSGTFGPVTFNGSLTGVRNPHLTYDATDVFVSFDYGALLPLLPQNADANSVHVATSIDDFTGNGGALPSSFQNLLTLQGPALAGALDHLAGETNAGFLQGAFQAGNAFLSLLLNPYADNRGSGGFGPAPAFAPAEPSRLPRAAAAFASVAPQAQTFDRRFGIWGSAYGGSGTTDGNAAAGSHTTTSQVFGLAAGVDRRVDPDTVLGFALAGGGMSWGLDAGLGGGHSDLFQAGAYGTRRLGPAYVSGALAYGFNAVTTNRTVTVAGTDRLTADFRTSSIGARIESGYRLAGPGGGITPYAAAQVQSIFLPAYAETASAGSAQFALAIGAQTATAARSEIGAWVDKSIALDAGALITVYARAAWAHDFGTAPAASATFQSLPGVSFIVDGAAPARDGALATAGAQWRGPDGWSVTAKFDGEFSSTTSIYAGSGVLRKEW